MTPWQQYKQRIAGTRSRDISTSIKNAYSMYSSKSQMRLEQCVGCEKLTTATKQCGENACFIAHFVIPANNSCPIGKW